MALYGNILTVYNTTGIQRSDVRNILNNQQTRFEELGDNFFVETTSVKNTENVVSDLRSLNVDFTFFHSHISDGANLGAAGINKTVVDSIKSILLNK